MRRCLIQVLFLASITCHPVDRESDENRPYEFGFTIDGEQHRYEKKDEKGIIMGEFGFITADGIYHVTVYATDENGDFKIISMKNIKVGFPPGKATTTTTTTTVKPFPKTNLQLNGIMGCSGCLIPESSPTMAPKGYPPDNKAFVSKDLSGDRNNNASSPENRFGPSGNSKVVPPTFKQQNELKPPSYPGALVPGTSIPNNLPDQIYVKPLNDKIHFTQTNMPGLYQTTKHPPKSITPNLPQNQINDTPNQAKLQPQLNEMEMKILDYMARLYKFNYTLSYHGHEETGDVGGNKNGSYFSNGRDGYQRKVVYIANEFGYQPKISLIKLDDEFIPKEETEKELTKLKGSEFIWF